VVTSYPQELLRRARSHLYTRETKSSFGIEHIRPTSTSTERCAALPHKFCRKFLSQDVASLRSQNINQLVCSAFSYHQLLVQQSFEVALQAPSVYIGADAFKVLNGELAILEQESDGFTAVGSLDSSPRLNSSARAFCWQMLYRNVTSDIFQKTVPALYH